MANEQNLIQIQNRPEKEQREMRIKAGIASGEARRRKKTMREELEIMLERVAKDKNGNDVSMQNSVVGALIMKAVKGDVRAFEVIRDTVGEKPVEKQEIIASITPERAKEFEELVNNIAK